MIVVITSIEGGIGDESDSVWSVGVQLRLGGPFTGIFEEGSGFSGDLASRRQCGAWTDRVCVVCGVRIVESPSKSEARVYPLDDGWNMLLRTGFRSLYSGKKFSP